MIFWLYVIYVVYTVENVLCQPQFMQPARLGRSITRLVYGEMDGCYQAGYPLVDFASTNKCPCIWYKSMDNPFPLDLSANAPPRRRPEQFYLFRDQFEPKTMKIIEIDYTDLNETHANTIVAAFPSLVVLRLDSNKMKQFMPFNDKGSRGGNRGVSQIRYASFARNQISEVSMPPALFPHIIDVKFDYNKLLRVPDDVQAMTTLIELRMVRCGDYSYCPHCHKPACHTHPYPTFTPTPNALFEDYSTYTMYAGTCDLRLAQTCSFTYTFALFLTTMVQAGNSLSSSSAFARLKQLMKLSVALNNFPNASGLSALTRLTSLYIQHNNLDNAALAEIAKTLPNLLELQIQYNPLITSLSVLSTMPELVFVDAGHTNVYRQAFNTKISTFLDGTEYCDGGISNSKVQCTPCCCPATMYDCAN